MKKNLLSLLLLLISLHSVSYTQEAFSINDTIDKKSIEDFFVTLRKSKAIYIKNGKISPEWLALSSEFETKIKNLIKDAPTLEVVPHSNIFSLPVITLDKNKENDFKKALEKIDPLSKTVYSYDASLIKKAFYALIHHHFIIVKKDGKYLLIFGTNCKNEAKKSAINTQKTRDAFIAKMSYWLKARLTVLMATR